MKYTRTELEILRKGGKHALEAYHRSARKPVPATSSSYIESKKYKTKHKKSVIPHD